MGFLSLFRGDKDEAAVEIKGAGPFTLTDPSAYDLFVPITSVSGVSVNPATAMRVPAVSAAVTLISNAIGNLPAKVFRRLDGGGKESAPEHPAYGIVHDDATEWQSAYEFRRQLTADAMLFGNAFAFVNRIGGRVVELVRFPPQNVTVKVSEQTGEPFYEVRQDRSAVRVYSFADILHLQAPFSDNGYTGTAPIVLGREAIGLAIMLERKAAQVFVNSSRPACALLFEKPLDDRAKERVSKAWSDATTGENSFKTPILEHDAKIVQFQFSSVDTQFLEMRTFQIDEIARAFCIPPTMLFELTRGTWSNTEQMNLQFLQLTLLPWLRAWEAAYRRALLPREDRSTFSIEFVVDDIARADLATRTEAYGKLISARAMTPNEVRARENLPALPGGDELANPYTTTSGAPVSSSQAETSDV